MGRLRDQVKIQTLARDLGVRASGDAVEAIVRFCERRVKHFVEGFPDYSTFTLSDVLESVASKVTTVFEVIRGDDDLQRIQRRYVERGEKGFANLPGEFRTSEDFGLTIRLDNREPWQPMFVSVIDCRGDKGYREYFTKWHEVVHLLIATDQMRLSFRRTHCAGNKGDPEEILVDIIAGRLGFRPPAGFDFAADEISFDAIESLRSELCPESSKQAALIGFVRYWPSPCLLVTAKPGLRKRELERLQQQTFSFVETPPAMLRAVQITPSNAAREAGFNIFRNMRIPEQSVIARLFADGGPREEAEAEECLSWWESSDGGVLPKCQVVVKARRSWDSVEALISPIDDLN